MILRRRRALAAAAVLALPAVALSAVPANAEETPDAYQALWDVAWNDHDLDGVSNAREAELGTNPQRPDTDADGLSDAQENQYCTDPSLPDTDGDTLTDAQEAAELKDERGFNLVYPLAADTDRDGVDDAAEIAVGTRPNFSDIPVSSWEEMRARYEDNDADGRSADEERYSIYYNHSEDWDTDTDDDGVPDGAEAKGCGNAEWGTILDGGATQASIVDTDGDGLSDAQEISRGTNANSVDSDGDGLSDAQEGFYIAPGVDWFDAPLVILVDPLDPDQNSNGVLDGQEFSLDGMTRA